MLQNSFASTHFKEHNFSCKGLKNKLKNEHFNVGNQLQHAILRMLNHTSVLRLKGLDVLLRVMANNKNKTNVLYNNELLPKETEAA